MQVAAHLQQASPTVPPATAIMEHYDDGNREEHVLTLDGNSLTVSDLMLIHENTKLTLTPESWDRVRRSRKVVDDIVAKGRVKYGINTGFGNFADVVVPPNKLKELQINLIRSHAAGVGIPLNIQRVKRLLALRINVLAKGTSSILSYCGR